MPPPESISLTDLQIKDALSPFGVIPSDAQIRQIRTYVALLLAWNRSISLTAITTPLEIIERHFGESIFAGQKLPVENCRLVDIGTGAGFPGLALKIAFPGLRLDLVESNKKKCAFLAEVKRALALSDVDIYAKRYEDIRPGDVSADIVASRAVGGFKDLLRWSSAALGFRGHVALWVGSEDSAQIMQTLGWTWQPPEHLPESERRFLLIGRPIHEVRKPDN